MTTNSKSPQQRTRKPPPVSFYLGDKESRDRRVASLERIAEQFGTTRSVLLQQIADGELIVSRPESPE